MKNRFIILILIIFLLIGVLGCSHEANKESADNAQSDSALDFTLKDLDGNSISLSDYRDKIVVLNFWASWCPPCKQEMPDLNELDKEFKKSDKAVFLSVNLTDGQRETKEKAQNYIDDNGFEFIVLIDDQSILADRYRIRSIPHTFILDKNGNISDSIIGATTKAKILEKVNEVK